MEQSLITQITELLSRAELLITDLPHSSKVNVAYEGIAVALRALN